MSGPLDYQSPQPTPRGRVVGTFLMGLGAALVTGFACGSLLGGVYERYSNGFNAAPKPMPPHVTFITRAIVVGLLVALFGLAGWMQHRGRRGFLPGVIVGLGLILLPVGWCFVVLDKG